MMEEEETLGRGPKGGGKKELGEEEWVSLNTSKEMGVLCVLEWRRMRVYIVVMEEIWMKCHLMKFDKESWT